MACSRRAVGSRPASGQEGDHEKGKKRGEPRRRTFVAPDATPGTRRVPEAEVVGEGQLPPTASITTVAVKTAAASPRVRGYNTASEPAGEACQVDTGISAVRLPGLSASVSRDFSVRPPGL